uniref:Uncharacterized protein n=1 Tax=Panagrolaimus superbus TaxID=310955 RepID=A0A914Y3T9_9BILA
MAFYGANSVSSAPFASAPLNTTDFDASRNLFMANADPDYFINPLDDGDACNNNQTNNISLACNAAMNQSCVWQGFVEGCSVAAPSEYEVSF